MEDEAAAAADQAETKAVKITVLTVTPVRAGKLFALASVEIDIDGVQIEVHGIRALHVAPAGTRIEVRRPIGDAVLDALIDHGLAKHRFATPVPT